MQIEEHVAGDGWDRPIRLFALIRTARALEQHPELADELPSDVQQAAAADPGHLTAIEQHGLPGDGSLEQLLGGLAWPETVDGCALSVERMVVDAAAQRDVPQDPALAAQFLAAHPSRQDVRVVAGALRDGTTYAAVRSRSMDVPDAVPSGPSMAPGLCEALVQTLRAAL